jgi:hypothetical protein
MLQEYLSLIDVPRSDGSCSGFGAGPRRIRILSRGPDWHQNRSRSGHEDKPQRLFDVTSAILITFASPEWFLTLQEDHPAYF